MKILVVLAILMFFSTFVSPFLAFVVSLVIYFVAHQTAFMKFYLVKYGKITPDSLFYKFVNFLYYIFPNFQDLSLKEYIFSSLLGSYNIEHIVFSLLSSVFYVGFFLILSIFIFNKKEF